MKLKINDIAKMLVQEVAKDSEVVAYMKVKHRNVYGKGYYRVCCGAYGCPEGECTCDWSEDAREHWTDMNNAFDYAYSFADFFGLSEENELIPYIYQEFVNQSIIAVTDSKEVDDFAAELVMQKMASKGELGVTPFWE